VRLFEAAACGTPIVSDAWSGLEEFFAPGAEILVAHTTGEMETILRDCDADAAAAIGAAARRRVLREHTAAHRAAELEAHLEEVASARPALSA
jgi:spore maturation protein CgeB